MAAKEEGHAPAPIVFFPRGDQAGFVPPLTGPTLVPMHGDFVLGLRGKLRRLRAMQSSIRSDPLRQMPLMVYACPRSKAPSQKRCGGSAGTSGGSAARRFQRHAPVNVDCGAAGGPRFPGALACPAPTVFARWAVHGETGAGALHPLHCRSRSVGGARGSEGRGLACPALPFPFGGRCAGR